MLTKQDFLAHAPVIIIDCWKQNESLKQAPVDVPLELESKDNFSVGATAYPHKKRVSERVLRKAMHIILQKVLPSCPPKVSSRVSARLSATLFARLFALAKRLPRVSDQIICMALCKTLSETRFFTRVVFDLARSNCRVQSNKWECEKTRIKGLLESGALHSSWSMWWTYKDSSDQSTSFSSRS